jgi:antitoxin ParD1/3/4
MNILSSRCRKARTLHWRELPYFDNKANIQIMSTKQVTRNIALTPHFDQFVQSKVESGRYQSASEVVRAALRLLEEQEEQQRHSLGRVRQDIEIGWQQSERGEVVNGPAVFAEIRKMSRSRREAAGTKR